MRSQKQLIKYALFGGVIVIIIFSFHFLKESKITGHVVQTQIETDPSIVLKLTFDDQNDPWKDYSMYNHIFTANGGVKWADKSVCKWYGCANFSVTDGSDYLNSSTKFKLDNGMAISFWLKINTKIDGANSQAFYQIGDEGPNLKWTEENGYGIWTKWKATNGLVGYLPGEQYTTPANVWTHYFLVYDKNRYLIWQNGIVIANISANLGNLNYSVGEGIYVGRGLYGIDIQGYLDEFVIYNKTNFTSTEVLGIYDSQKFGTPPTLDLYVKAIKYQLPVDWNTKNHPLIQGTMPITITLANAGTTNSESFAYNFILDENTICSGRIGINALTEKNITCDWTTSYGFHKGSIIVDSLNEIAEDNEANNVQRVYIPFLDRPYLHFNYSEWNNYLLPYASNSSNYIVFNTYNFYKFHVAEDFNNDWVGNDVDPRGKKGRENAISCMLNNYDMTKVQCIYAKNHLFGWANRSLDTYSNVQSIHELFHVGMIYDVMFPTLTQSEYQTLSKKYYDICQYITNLKNTRPDLDVYNQIDGGNGFGFGSGMGGFCYSIIGEYPENPTLIQQLNDQYWGKNIPDSWMQREIAYLRSFKNDLWSKYQEGWLYKFYSQFHLVENLWFEKRFGLNNFDDYQNAVCSMGRELVTDLNDYSYNGQKLRNDESQRIRGVQRGDSNSYEDEGSDSVVGWSIADYYATLCDDVQTKESLIYLREIAYNLSEPSAIFALPDIYVYKQARSSLHPENPSQFFPKVIFDNANDILTIRTNYTYVNDNLIEIDGGEERGGGHSQAQGYYLYVLGEPFLDYHQVPYEDDVRAETWENGVSLQNTQQTIEGTGGTYSENCRNAPLNQYYGMRDCSIPQYPTDYPDYRQFPLQYGGDLENYVGTKDANFAGVYVWRPYKNADDVREYFVKFGDLLAKRTLVKNNKQGQGVYHNFIDIYNEFSETRSGNNLTLTRNGKNLDVNLVYSNQTFSLGGGDSGLTFCFTKTDCSSYNRGNGHYRRTYLFTKANDVDFILAHHWYTTGNRQPISAITGIDNGLQQGNNIIIFDTNGDDISAYSDKKATGWALAYNDNTKEIAAFNTTSIKAGNIDLLSSTDTLSAHLQRASDKIILTVNTMQRNKFIDYPKTVRITIDAQELTNNSKFVITKNGNENILVISETGTKVTFDAISGQNSDYYTITGGGAGSIPADVTPPAITFLGNDSTTNQSSYIKAQTDENANLTVLWGYSINKLASIATNTLFQTTSTVLLSSLTPNTIIYYNATSCDASGNCASKGLLNFTTAKTYIPPNLAPNINSFQPSSLKPQYNFTTIIIFNITGSDPENDNLALQWFVNNTLNTSNQNLTYAFNKIGVFNITAILSDNNSNTSKQWLAIIINDTQQALPPKILGTDFSPPTIITNIHWLTSILSDSKVDYGTSASFGATITDSTQTKDHMLSLINLIPGTKYYFKVTSCNAVGCDSSPTLNFTTVAITTSKYNGLTTDLSKLVADNITNLTLENSLYGKIYFFGFINITRSINIDAYTNITSSSIFVDSANFPELNVPATITFYSLNFTNPRIMKDGVACPDTVCKVISQTNTTITFNVTGFSTYTVEETPASSSSSSSLSSSSSSSSSGGSSSGGGSSGGGGGGVGGGTAGYVCNKDWQCTSWSACTDGLQTRECNFVKVAQHTQNTECPTIDIKPATSQSCTSTIQQNTSTQNEILFAATLKIPSSYKKIKPGNNLNAQITINNLGQGSVGIAATYTIKDSSDATILQQLDTLKLDQQLSFTKTFKLPQNIAPGDYTAKVNLQHDSIFADASDTFTVTKPSKSIFSIFTTNVISGLNPGIGFLKNNVIISLIGLILILFSAIPVLYFVHNYGSNLKGLSKHEINLYNYVKKSLKQGFTEEEIHHALLKAGWKKENIGKVMEAIRK